jgi:hypothetical protein
VIRHFPVFWMIIICDMIGKYWFILNIESLTLFLFIDSLHIIIIIVDLNLLFMWIRLKSWFIRVWEQIQAPVQNLKIPFLPIPSPFIMPWMGGMPFFKKLVKEANDKKLHHLMFLGTNSRYLQRQIQGRPCRPSQRLCRWSEENYWSSSQPWKEGWQFGKHSNNFYRIVGDCCNSQERRQRIRSKFPF